jgi:anti-sigma factor RsiW
MIYNELPAVEAAAVADHLADCPACRSERAALQATRAALDSVPSPGVALDAGRLMQEFVTVEARQSRRWRRFALAASAIAAGLLLILAARVQVRIGDRQLTIAWGAPPPIAPAPASGPRPDAELSERVQLVQDLTRAVLAEVETRDGLLRNELLRIRGDLIALQRQSAERWAATERDVTAIYQSTFVRPESGGKP